MNNARHYMKLLSWKQLQQLYQRLRYQVEDDVMLCMIQGKVIKKYQRLAYTVTSIRLKDSLRREYHVQGYPRGSKELLSPFSKHFGPQETYEWYKDKGVILKIEADGRVFPNTDRLSSIDYDENLTLMFL